MKIRPKLAYFAAALTLVAAILVPFVLIDFFTNRVGALGLHVDEVYVAGPVVGTIERNGYRIEVHKATRPHFFQRAEPYVQLAWTPMKALPTKIADEVDIDGDGKVDVRVSFASPHSEAAALRGNVDALNPSFLPLTNVGKESFSRMIAVIHDKVVVRVPMKK